MTIDPKCSICRNRDLRQMVALAWNGSMGFEPIARALDRPGLGVMSVTKHIKQHEEGNPSIRAIEIDERTVRERITDLQRLQLDEIERRIGLAQTRAALMNKEREGLLDADGNPWPDVDWSDMYDILSPKAQAAISSILKTQGLSDKREKATADLKLGLFEAMSKAGLAPKALVGGKVPELPAGDEEIDELGD